MTVPGSIEIEVEIEDRTRLPQVHRPGDPGREDRALAAMGAPPSGQGRGEVDIECRRRDQLRDARAGPSPPRLRCGFDRREPPRGEAGGRRRGVGDPRWRDPGVDRGRPRDLRQRGPDLDVGDHGRCPLRGLGRRRRMSSWRPHPGTRRRSCTCPGATGCARKRPPASSAVSTPTSPTAPTTGRLPWWSNWPGGSVPEASLDVIGTRLDPVTVELAVSEVNRIIGPGFGRDEVSGILERLGMSVDGEDPIRVLVPTYRPDVTRPADLVEEVARIHGYDKFDSTVPIGPAGGLTTEQRRLRRLHSALCRRRYPPGGHPAFRRRG